MLHISRTAPPVNSSFAAQSVSVQPAVRPGAFLFDVCATPIGGSSCPAWPRVVAYQKPRFRGQGCRSSAESATVATIWCANIKVVSPFGDLPDDEVGNDQAQPPTSGLPHRRVDLLRAALGKRGLISMQECRQGAVEAVVGHAVATLRELTVAEATDCA